MRKKCKDCNNTGIAIVTLDTSTDTGIQRCDTCKTLTDSQAVRKVERVLTSQANECLLKDKETLSFAISLIGKAIADNAYTGIAAPSMPINTINRLEKMLTKLSAAARKEK